MTLSSKASRSLCRPTTFDRDVCRLRLRLELRDAPLCLSKFSVLGVEGGLERGGVGKAGANYVARNYGTSSTMGEPGARLRPRCRPTDVLAGTPF